MATDFIRNGRLALTTIHYLDILPAMSVETLVELAQVRALLRSGKAKEIREAAGLSQAEVAEALGVHTSTVYRWEAGECAPMGPAGLKYGELLHSLLALVGAAA
jgi:DNA-binding XRE family transcriptional regulator